ncbi:TonB-dependent receptor [Parasulfuritortus cantonensis]|uniref:TonB-dependent receptor n=2 Tax=Parasulfuritortus cantonensis TaxID=2528202 RepID=A0A4R1B7I9_9PROT|nr:TonB-dependent receptor [Parasulfuritortus cantonensis]
MAPCRGLAAPPAEEPAAVTLDTVLVSADAEETPIGAGVAAQAADLAPARAATSDAAALLGDLPGVSLYGAGGISSLPVLHGLADDRVRIQVDGMDLMPACPNHMNSALSYIAPERIEAATVFAGITPVSAGGDSLAGTIQVRSPAPEFATTEGATVSHARAGAYYRSNGHAQGYNLGATLATDTVSLSYGESDARADNYTAGKAFKAAGAAAPGRGWLAGDEVGSSAYRGARNRDFGLAVRRAGHLFELDLGEQQVGFEGFPNQRMDMTDNRSRLANLHYTGRYGWGELEARVYRQDVRHAMDMGPDRFSYGFGMPMKTEAATRGAQIKGSVALTGDDLLRVGAELQNYDLDDWWPPVGSAGSMCCEAFWNVRDGRRDRAGLYAEWEARWSPTWVSLLGLRGDRVRADAGTVQGYNTSMGIWTTDAAAFNALARKRTNHNWDLTALARYVPDPAHSYEAGYARKSRSPNLYERYPWSTNAMAALMNNFVGDGNGYVGNPDLKPEVAHTLSASADWHAPAGDGWQLKATAYLTYVDDFIDARRCDSGQCSAANATKTEGFVILQYANQDARLYGIDVAGHRALGRLGGYGEFTLKGALSYVRGENRRTGNDLYHIMPLNAKLTLEQRLGAWTNAVELQSVATKTKVSTVRNEVPTGGYTLVNLRSRCEWKHTSVDLGVDNLFDRYYELPLGGAYVGQGMSMSTATLPWGVTVPGMGRSLYLALNLHF